jgi:hypothetical protein
MIQKPRFVLPTINAIDKISTSPNIKTRYKCKNCSKYFNPEKNEKCYYHPGEQTTSGLRTNNYYDEIRFTCCEGVQIGFNPVVKESKGCKMKDYHELLSN